MSATHKREEKQAYTRLEILDRVLDLLGLSQLDHISVEAIAARAGVSRISFFRYYPKKKDIFLYLMRFYMLEQVTVISHRKLKGRDGLEALFLGTCESWWNRPGVWGQLIAYLGALPKAPKKVDINFAERVEFAKRRKIPIYDGEIPDLPELLSALVFEAFPNLRKDDEKLQHMIQALLAVFYGTPLVTEVRKKAMGDSMRRHLTLVLHEFGVGR